MSLIAKKPGIKAGSLSASTLPIVNKTLLCQDHVDGFCRRGDSCSKNHQLCIVDHERASPPVLQSEPNELSFQPRLVARPFEDDGPGDISGLGPRHDNDHVEIHHVSILPTTDEILSLRSPYMPSKDPRAPHRLPLGQPRLLDIDFRQLRYDSIEGIIDCCYHASQQLSQMEKQTHFADYDERQRTPKGSHYSLFNDIAFEEVLFHDLKGVMMRVSFACPHGLRGRRMASSNRLEEGMLVALVGLANGTYTSVTFMEIYQRQTTESMRRRTGNDSRGSSLVGSLQGFYS